MTKKQIKKAIADLESYGFYCQHFKKLNSKATKAQMQAAFEKDKEVFNRWLDHQQIIP